MTSVNPNTAKNLLPTGTKEITFAKDQPEYVPLPAVVTPGGKVLTQWIPSPGELALLNQGVPVTLVVWHGKFSETNLLRPVQLAVGGMDLR